MYICYIFFKQIYQIRLALLVLEPILKYLVILYKHCSLIILLFSFIHLKRYNVLYDIPLFCKNQI